jgi:hypothetical protein
MESHVTTIDDRHSSIRYAYDLPVNDRISPRLCVCEAFSDSESSVHFTCRGPIPRSSFPRPEWFPTRHPATRAPQRGDCQYRGATKAIKTLPSQYYWGSLAKDLRDYVRAKPISAQRLVDGAVPASSPRMRHPRRSGPKCPLISCLNHQKRKLVVLDKLCWFINSPNNLNFCH